MNNRHVNTKTRKNRYCSHCENCRKCDLFCRVKQQHMKVWNCCKEFKWRDEYMKQEGSEAWESVLDGVI